MSDSKPTKVISAPSVNESKLAEFLERKRRATAAALESKTTRLIEPLSLGKRGASKGKIIVPTGMKASSTKDLSIRTPDIIPKYSNALPVRSCNSKITSRATNSMVAAKPAMGMPSSDFSTTAPLRSTSSVFVDNPPLFESLETENELSHGMNVEFNFANLEGLGDLWESLPPEFVAIANELM
jgi:hypothetical protein